MTKSIDTLKSITTALSPEHLKGLEVLSKINPDRVPHFLAKKMSWVGRFFKWIDDNILDKTTRLWMYLLEALGGIIICIFVSKFTDGLDLILKASNELEMAKAQAYIDAIKTSAAPISVMVATICGALPTVMGMFRAFKTKWKSPSDNSQTIPIVPSA